MRSVPWACGRRGSPGTRAWTRRPHGHTVLAAVMGPVPNEVIGPDLVGPPCRSRNYRSASDNRRNGCRWGPSVLRGARPVPPPVADRPLRLAQESPDVAGAIDRTAEGVYYLACPVLNLSRSRSVPCRAATHAVRWFPWEPLPADNSGPSGGTKAAPSRRDCPNDRLAGGASNETHIRRLSPALVVFVIGLAMTAQWIFMLGWLAFGLLLRSATDIIL